MKDFDKIIAENQCVLIVFYASWCGPCAAQSSIIEHLKPELEGKATILKLDIEKNEELADKFNVRAIPTLILFKSGNQVWRKTGVQTAKQILTEINRQPGP